MDRYGSHCLEPQHGRADEVSQCHDVFVIILSLDYIYVFLIVSGSS
jgi:hypothetical protein